MPPEPLRRGALPCAVLAGRLRRRHTLPSAGRLLVEAGDAVRVGQLWGRCRLRRGVDVVDLPRLLRVQTDEAQQLLAVSVGAVVEEGTLLASTSGKMRTGRQWTAPSRGTLADVSPRTGVAVFVRETREVALHCVLTGVVTWVDPAEGLVVEGDGVAVAAALGGGGRVNAPLRFIESGEQPDRGADGGAAQVLVTPEPLRADWLRRALEVQAAGIVAPSTNAEIASGVGLAPALAGFSPADDAFEQPPMPLVLTEGVGFARMPRVLQDTFRAAEGEVVTVIGARRPGQSEVLLPASVVPVVQRRAAAGPAVRVASGPRVGTEGVVLAAAPDIGRAPSGVAAAFVRIRQAEGGVAALPALNLATLT